MLNKRWPVFLLEKFSSTLLCCLRTAIQFVFINLIWTVSRFDHMWHCNRFHFNLDIFPGVSRCGVISNTNFNNFKIIHQAEINVFFNKKICIFCGIQSRSWVFGTIYNYGLQVFYFSTNFFTSKLLSHCALEYFSNLNLK